MLVHEAVARNRRDRPDAPYILHEGQTVTFAEFDARTNRTAHAFRSLGVDKGDRVTLAMRNSVEWVVAAFGALKAGAVLHPVNPELGAKELGFILAHAEPRVIVVDAGETHLPTSREGAPRVSFGAAPDAEDLRPRLARSSEAPLEASIGEDDASTLLYTSGTTGKPKGVLFTHQRGGVQRVLADRLGITHDDVILTVGPLFHGNAWAAASVAQQAGCAVAFPRSFSASEFWPLAHRTGATALFTLGTILAILLAEERGELEGTSRIRVVLGLGSAPLRERVLQRFGCRHLVECFGSTDAGVVTIEPLDATPRAGSAGPPIDGVTVRILDDERRPVAIGEVGEIAVQSPYRMAAYFRDPEQTRAALDGEWFLTGDLGRLDADGWLYFVDRKRDVIRRGGENIASILVESALREHPMVRDAAVIGVRHPVLGQEVKAFIVASGPVTIEELQRFAAERLARFQVPTLWEFREVLPRTPTQRVEKYKLRDDAGGTGGPLLG